MIEEIRKDNNCIVKAFENNPIAILQEDINNKKVYCFKAIDIGKALKLTNIAQSIQNYDEDEKVLRKAYDLRGCEQDTMFLTSQGVYRLLYNSKKEIAKKFRKWAGNILDDIIFNESAELKRQLEEKDKIIEKTQKQLETVSKLTVKRWYDSEPGHTVYAYKNTKEDCTLIKLGKSKDTAIREASYTTTNQSGEMFYVKKCYNCDLAEKVIHHILDKYRCHQDKEWFDISEELSIYTIDIVCDFLDKFINFSEELPKSNIKENLNNSIELIKNLSDEIKENIYTEISVKEVSFVNKIVKKEVVSKDYEYELKNIKKFIEEACEIDENNSCLSYELFGAYRIYSRGLKNKSRSNLTRYLRENYKSESRFYQEYNESSILTYIGIKPKIQKIYENKNITKPYEIFIKEECKYNYTFRIKWTDFIKELEKWLEIKYPTYNFTKEEKVNMESCINKYFLRDHINISGAPNVPGIYGLQMKNDNSIKVGINPTNRKPIVKINKETKQIEKEYSYLTIAAMELNYSTQHVCKLIKNKKIINNEFYLQYKENIEVV
jgi:prophage antirepressor-like protein